MINKRQMKKTTLIYVLAVLLFGTSVYADVQSQNTKNSTLKLSFSERFRFVSWDNATSLDRTQAKESSFTRHRTSLMAQWIPKPGLELAVKLTNEFRYYFVPEGRDFNLHEVFVDNLYVKSNKPWDLPLSFIIGRQNIMLGEGFLVMDGHPLDGSRSIYFNAARMDLFLNKSNKLILFYTYQPETDNYLPVINNKDQKLIEQPEEGIGIYFSGKFNEVNLDSYLIRKNIHSTDTKPMSSCINTAGSRFVYQLLERFSMTGEGAIQFGNYGDFDRLSFGGYLHLDYKTNKLIPLLQTATLGTIYLAGDDPETERWEGWDPLFSRWPKWSESYIYTLIPEYNGKVAYWSNFISIYGTLKFKVSRDIDLNLSYHHLVAAENSDLLSAFSGGNGKTRGGLLIAKSVFKLNKHLTGHVLWEFFSPGNFYRPGADCYNWFRFELIYRI